jgi:ring-1,2-phenylacetyl-CoA epoxidase subunit PaaE
MSQFHTLKVASVARNTRDAVVVTFEVPEHLADTFAFRPGQYLTLRTRVNGEELRRSYSICAAPHDRQLRVAIKRLNDGAFSTWANTALQAGDLVDVMPPDGNFTTPSRSAAASRPFSRWSRRHWTSSRNRPSPCSTAIAHRRRCCSAKRSKTSRTVT